MYERLLEGSGLTKNESAVYLALLQIGKSKTGEIVHEAKVSSGKIYETLEKLADKGLVKSVTENGVKHFIANDPEALLDFLKEKKREMYDKEKELEKVLPELKTLKQFDEKLETVSLLKGMRGVHPLIYGCLEKGENIRIMGIRSSKNIKYNNFWKRWHQRRLQLKKNAKLIFCDKNTDYWRYFKPMENTEVREFLSFTPSATMVVDDNVFIFSYDEDLTCIHINSKSIATSFERFFDGLWEISVT